MIAPDDPELPDGHIEVAAIKQLHEVVLVSGTVREVEGEGVVGQQPTLEPGESHQYVSGCNLKTGIGKMTGHYTMERLVDGREFKVEIPEFVLIVPYKLN